MKDIIFNKSEDELEKVGIYLLNENGNVISINANNRSISFRTENNTYIINVSDDNGSLAIIKIKNYDKKQISYLSGDSVCICIKDIGDE